ncbi:MAG: protein kinase domain-containing protein [Planctomycetales bacterium]
MSSRLMDDAVRLAELLRAAGGEGRGASEGGGCEGGVEPPVGEDARGEERSGVEEGAAFQARLEGDLECIELLRRVLAGSPVARGCGERAWDGGQAQLPGRLVAMADPVVASAGDHPGPLSQPPVREWSAQNSTAEANADRTLHVPDSRSTREPSPSDRDSAVLSLGRFDIVRELGSGTFGVVFLAYDRDLGREVALKVPRPEVLVTAKLRERFLREARLAAGLDHPHLVPVFDVRADGPVCYIVEAYCPGTTLAAWLKEFSEPMPAREAARLMVTLAEAVEHAHRAGVIHRDLKPTNILLQDRCTESGQAHFPGAAPGTATGHTESTGENRENTSRSPGRDPRPHGPTKSTLPERGAHKSLGNYVPRIADFGLAKLIDDAYLEPTHGTEYQTQTGALLGTPEYMAPEQASRRAREIGPSADLYALGTILYQLVAGRLPFRGETTLDTLEMVRTQDPISPRQLAPRLPKDLETICLKCLEKEPPRRYGSAQELADDLQLFLQGAPIRARPLTFWQRWWKSARRHPARGALVCVSIAAVAALVAVVGLYNAHLSQKNVELAGALEDAHAAQREAEQSQRQAEASRKSALVSKQEAEANLQAADENLNLARKGVFEFATRQVDEPRAPHNDLEFLRKNILLAALDFYDKLALRRPGDVEIEAETAVIEMQLGRVKLELRHVLEALPDLEKAGEILQRVTAEHPELRDYELSLARLYMNLGHAHYWSGDACQRTALTDQANRLATRLSRQDPESDERRFLLGQSYNCLAALWLDHEREDLVQPAALLAQEFAERLVCDHPQMEKCRALHIESLDYLGAAQLRTGRLEEARAALVMARDLAQALVNDDSSNEDYRSQLARCHADLSYAYWMGGQLEEAAVAYGQARDLFAERCRRHQDSLVRHDELLIVLHNLSVLSTELHRPEVAEPMHFWAMPIVRDHVEHFDFPDYHYFACVRPLAHGFWESNGEWWPSASSAIESSLLWLRHISKVHETRASYRATLARATSNWGTALFAEGELQRAGQAFEESRVMAEEIVADHPTIIDFAIDLASINFNLGQFAESREEHAPAFACYSRAIDLLQDKLQHMPPRAEAWRFLGVTYAARAEVLSRLDRPDEMRADLTRLAALECRWEGDYVRLHRACLLTASQRSPGDATGETSRSPWSAELPALCSKLGLIYLFDRLEFRQQVPLY